jgi:two-component system, LytTR family, response regulator
MRRSWDGEAAMHSGLSAMSSFPLFLPVRTLIVGEKQRSRERVRSLLERTDEAEVVRESESVVEALEAIHGEEIDLLFLDVEPPELTGLALLATLGERCPQIIFAAPAHAA